MKRRKALKDRLSDLDDGYGIEYALKILPSVKKAIGGKNGKIYAKVDTVSRSGMSRTISLYIMHQGELINLNYTPFAQVYGDTISNKGWGKQVRINGCGMDMLFEATYRLYHFLFTQSRRPYQNHLNRYNSL